MRYQDCVSVHFLLQPEGHLHGLAIARWTPDHYRPCLNLDVGISEGCFIFDFTSLPLEAAQPIYPTMCTKVVVKHQSIIIYNQSFLLRGRYLFSGFFGSKWIFSQVNIFSRTFPDFVKFKGISRTCYFPGFSGRMGILIKLYATAWKIIYFLL